ncbi:MAG: GNAT family N-acetyltransferase [Paracoccaceae bacterium]|jgi:ribosomal-protein-alanine N-acetyltransferase
MRLETNRLAIDHLSSGDLLDLHRMDTDLRVRHYIDGKASSLEKTKEYLCENIISYRENGYGRYAIRDADTNEFLGICGFLKESYGVDFGYRFLPSCWGKGIATEAASTVLEKGIADNFREQIVGIVLPENKASINVLRKVGFKWQENLELYGFKVEKYTLQLG